MSSKISEVNAKGIMTIEIDLSETKVEKLDNGETVERVAYWGKGFNVTKVTWKGKTYNLSGSVNVSKAKPKKQPRASF